MTVKRGEPFQLDCSGCEVALIRLVMVFSQLKQVSWFDQITKPILTSRSSLHGHSLNIDMIPIDKMCDKNKVVGSLVHCLQVLVCRCY